MNTLNIDRLTAVMSGILTDRYGVNVLVTVKEGKEDETDREDCNSDSRSIDYGRRLRTG